MQRTVNDWPPPSPAARELVRRAAEAALEIALRPDNDLVAELHERSLGAERMEQVAADPVLSDGVRRANISNLTHWITHNIRDPGRRVPANVGQDVLDTSRELVRRGFDAGALDTYRQAQNVAWRAWMEICFSLSTDAAVLKETFEVCHRSISTFLDDTVEALALRMEAERDELARGTHAERRATVSLLIEGAPIARTRAELQLGYPLTGPHTALVVWTSHQAGLGELERTVEEVARASGASRWLSVVAGAGTLWLWLPVAQTPPSSALSTHLLKHEEIRVAAGRPGRDVEGFRSSHLDALTVQRMMARLASPQQVGRFEDVHLVTLMTQDPTAADEFVKDVLGDLATADVQTRTIVSVYVEEQCSTSRTADRLYTHRNTVIRRLARADELLPRPLSDNVVAVGAALEYLRWRGRQS